MNIESKRYKIRSIGAGLVEILHKVSGHSVTRSIADVPSVHRLAMMKEPDFDRAMADLS